MLLAFHVDGRPISQPRPRVVRGGLHAFMPKPYVAYREEVSLCAQAAALELEQRGEPWDATRRSYRVRLRFVMPDHQRTDIDKLQATILDALERAGVFEDDRFVDQVTARRRVERGVARVEVEVEPLLVEPPALTKRRKRAA
jgi:Holliday junction resolvase RusA-like endonuclease